MAQDPRSFSPDAVEANRTRQQGNGVGQRELSGQRDGGEVDAEAIAEDLEAEGSHQGIGRRDGSPVDREHGAKTRAHNKDIISGRA